MNIPVRAMAYLKSTHYFTSDELYGMKKVLTAAAFTYLAATLAGVLQLVRLLSIINDD